MINSKTNKTCNILLIIISIFLLNSCKRSVFFNQTRCELYESPKLYSLILQFDNGFDKRTIRINLENKVIIFKGTKLSDGKWAIDFEDVKGYTISEKSLFGVTFENNKNFEFGEINNQCKVLLTKHLLIN